MNEVNEWHGINFEELLLMEDKDFKVPNEDKYENINPDHFQIDREMLKADLRRETPEGDDVGFKRLILRTDDLKPTKKHFDFEKTKFMSNSGLPLKEIVVSKDNFVIDGHHRWLASHAGNGHVKAIVVNKNATDLVKYLKNKPYAKKYKIVESQEQVIGESVDKTVWYHGTPKVFDTVKIGTTGYDENGPGFYMTTSSADAHQYIGNVGEDSQPNILPVYHSITNPIPLNHVFSRDNIAHIIKNSPDLNSKLNDYGDISHSGYNNVLNSAIDAHYTGQNKHNNRSAIHTINGLSNDFYQNSPQELLKHIHMKTGFDGVVVKRTPTVYHAVAWFPHQVKSIYSNM